MASFAREAAWTRPCAGQDGPAARWRAVRDAIRNDILQNGWSEKRKSFVQAYGGEALDASLLQVPLVGFLPPDDPRVVGTIEAIRRDLVEDGFVLRYSPEHTADGLEGDEGTFLVCSFWLADALAMMGRPDEAEALFERLLDVRNDLGLLAEEYDPRAKRQLGNFPQAFSHVGLVNTANNLISAHGPARQRAGRRPGGAAPGGGRPGRRRSTGVICQATPPAAGCSMASRPQPIVSTVRPSMTPARIRSNTVLTSSSFAVS